jgi:hypothetical protein
MIQHVLIFFAKYLAVGVVIDIVAQILFAMAMRRRLGPQHRPWLSHFVVVLLWPASILAFVSGAADRAKKG